MANLIKKLEIILFLCIMREHIHSCSFTYFTIVEVSCLLLLVLLNLAVIYKFRIRNKIEEHIRKSRKTPRKFWKERSTKETSKRHLCHFQKLRTNATAIMTVMLILTIFWIIRQYSYNQSDNWLHSVLRVQLLS